jgi:hypothetical protein
MMFVAHERLPPRIVHSLHVVSIPNALEHSQSFPRQPEDPRKHPLH